MPARPMASTLLSRLRQAVWLRMFVAFIVLCNIAGAHACVQEDLVVSTPASSSAVIPDVAFSSDSAVAPESTVETLNHALAVGSCSQCACHHGCVVSGIPAHDFQSSPTSSPSFSASAAKPSTLEPSLRPPIL